MICEATAVVFLVAAFGYLFYCYMTSAHLLRKPTAYLDIETNVLKIAVKLPEDFVLLNLNLEHNDRDYALSFMEDTSRALTDKPDGMATYVSLGNYYDEVYLKTSPPDVKLGDYIDITIRYWCCTTFSKVKKYSVLVNGTV
jgi:hypothetical protein